MNPDSAPAPARTPYIAALAGLVLISIDPLLFFGPLDSILAKLGGSPQVVAERAQNFRFYAHFALGLPGVFVGFFLLAPLFVRVVERVVGPLVAWMLRLSPALLRQQLSSGIWRAAGTAAALMVGLAVLVVMEVQGNTALSGWRLPTKFPDIFIVSPPSLSSIWQSNGVTFDQEKEIEKVPGIIPGEVMPIAIAFPKLGTGFLAVPNILANPDATIFFGIDPDRAFKLMELEFRDGTQEMAQRMLKNGKDVTLKEGSAPDPKDASLDAGGNPVIETKGITYDKATKRWTLHGLVAEQGDSDVITLPRGEQRRFPKSAVEKIEDGRFLIVTNEFKELKHLVVGDQFGLERQRRQDGLLHDLRRRLVAGDGRDGRHVRRRPAVRPAHRRQRLRHAGGRAAGLRRRADLRLRGQPRLGRAARGLPRARQETAPQPGPQGRRRAADQGADRQELLPPAPSWRARSPSPRWRSRAWA